MSIPGDMMVVLLAAGQSTRMGGSMGVSMGGGINKFGDVAKPFLLLAGKPVYRHALDVFAAMTRCAGGVVVVAKNAPPLDNLPDGWTTTIGGASRVESARAGLEALAAQDPPPRFVFIHDAARPFVPQSVVAALLRALDDGAAGVIPAIPVADSLKRMENKKITGAVDRDGLVAVQTPQGFVFDVILRAHRNNKDVRLTDDSALLAAAGIDVVCVDGDPQLMKITRGPDLALAGKIAFALAHDNEE